METINYKGFVIEIHQDDMSQDPNTMGDMHGYFLQYEHRDLHIESKRISGQETFNFMTENPGVNLIDVRRMYLKEGESFFMKYWFFPVYAYIHSGVALSLGRSSYPFNDRWDVSFKGFVYINAEEWPDEEEAFKVAGSVIEEWNQYLSGDVWGFKVLDIDDEDEIDSCWGYYGKEYCIEEAKSIVDYQVKELRNEHLRKVKTWVKNRVPLNHRFANQFI